MVSVRRALMHASLGRYAAMAMGVVSTLVVARLMTPAEFGVSVVAASALGVAQALRQSGSVQYLIQEHDLTAARIHTSFTIGLIVTLVMSTLFIVLAPWIEAAYQINGLGSFLVVQAFGYLVGAFSVTNYGLLARERQFGWIAFIDIATSTLSAVTMIGLVATGHSYMGIAWAGLASSTLSMLLLFVARSDTRSFVLTLREWHRVLTFGFFGSATAFVYKCSEAGWYLLAGGLMDARAVGLLQRAALLATFPDRVILAGAANVALPSFSHTVQRGEPVAASYLHWIANASAILWPALTLVGLFAHQIVTVVLGGQWLEAVPLVHILAGSTALMFPLTLNNAVQLATGGVKSLPLIALAQAAIALPVLYMAAHYGLVAVAWSTFATGSAAAVISTVVARRYAGFAWSSFAASLWPSAVVALATAIGPATLIMSGLIRSSILMLIIGGVAGGLGWLAGVYAVRHPIRTEVERVVAAARRRLGG